MATKYFNDTLAISTHRNAVIAFKNTKTESNSTVAIDVKNKQGKVISWGPNNAFPQELMEAIKKSGTAKAGLRFNKKTHYGNGLVLMKTIKDDDSDKRNRVPVHLEDYKEIKDFFRKSQMKKFWKEIISDEETFYLAFPEYILSADYKKINRVKRQRVAWSRYQEMNSVNGLIENLYYSQKFGRETVDVDGKYCATIPLVDPYWSAEEVKEYCKKKKIKKFIRPVFYPLTDEAFYPVADWHTILESGWLNVANSIPEFKEALFENQISIKYLVEIDERYFEMVYNDTWEDFSVDERKEKRQEVIDLIDEHLGGNKNAGKTIQSMRIDIGGGETVSAITITAIDDKFKEGSYLPEASAANSEIAFALNLDPSIIGAGIPGGKLGAGSGSDKREAFLIASALKNSDRDTTLEIFDFIQEYNEWPSEIEAHFENTILTTLDKNPTGTQNAIN